MQIRVRAQSLPAARSSVDEAERRVRRAVAGIARRVSRIAVRLFDVNGPRGGVDKACEVSVSLGGAGTVRYQAAARTLATATRMAILGIRRSVTRRLAVRREMRRRLARRTRAVQEGGVC